MGSVSTYVAAKIIGLRQHHIGLHIGYDHEELRYPLSMPHIER